jgi:spermidine synthase
MSDQYKYDYVILEKDSNNFSYDRSWKIGSHHASIVAKFNTSCAEVCVLETQDFGKVVLLDGEIQSTAADQKFYHQALCRPARVIAEGDIKRVLVLGGGELCTIKHVLEWPHVEKVDMVDYDKTFVEFAKRRLRDWHGDSYKDPRVNLIFADAWSYTAGSPPDNILYDSIIVDLTDVPLDADEWPKFIDRWEILMENLVRWLRPSGSMTVYAGMYIPWKSSAMTAAYGTMKGILRRNGRKEVVQPYRTLVPSFGCGEAFFLSIGSRTIKQAIDDGIWRQAEFPAGVGAEQMFGEAEGMRAVIWGSDADSDWNSGC